jgi:hypothetical protein
MFTTPTYTPVGGFIDGTGTVLGSRLRGGWLNYVSGQFPNALDAINGGYYQFVADIELSSDSAQIKINAPDVAQPTKLLGFTTIGLSDDVNYATGTGTLTVAIPATFTAGVTMSGALTFSNTVQFNGAVTVNAATTFTSNGDVTLQSGCAVTGSSGSSLTMQNGTTTTVDVLNVNDTLTMASNQNIVLTGTGKVTFAAPRSYRQPCRLVWVDTGYWGPDATLPLAWPHRVQQTNATNVSDATTNLRYECDIPPGASVVTVTVWIQPAAGHGGSMPANRPQLIVWIYDSDAETSPQTGSPAVANEALAVDYEQRTLLTVTAGVNTLAVPQKVICQVYGESGANFLAGLIVDEPTFTFSTSQMNEP